MTETGNKILFTPTLTLHYSVFFAVTTLLLGSWFQMPLKAGYFPQLF